MALGLPRYFTGKPCVRGYIAERETNSGACVVCRLEGQREYDARNREERRRKRRDQKRAKKIGARFEVLPSALPPKAPALEESVSLVVYEGPNAADDAQAWLGAQARRLGVEMQFIMDAIGKGWTLVEIETLPRDDAQQLSKPVHEVKRGQGFTGWNDYNPVLNAGEMN